MPSFLDDTLWPRFVVLTVALVLTLPVTLAVHEGGHFCAARWLSLRVLSFEAGPVRVEWIEGLRRLRVQPLKWLGGGLVRVVMPTTMTPRARGLFYAAGPVANLAFVVLYGAGCRACLGRTAAASLAAWLLGGHAALSLICFLLSAFPMRVQPWSPLPSDGYRVLTLLRLGSPRDT